MTKKLQELLEELGEVAAKPVATDDSAPRELKVSMDNSDVYPADEHKQAEDIEGLIIESYALLGETVQLALTEDLAGLQNRMARGTYKNAERVAKINSKIKAKTSGDINKISDDNKELEKIAVQQVEKNPNADVGLIGAAGRTASKFAGKAVNVAGNVASKAVTAGKDIFNKVKTAIGKDRANTAARAAALGVTESIKFVLTEMKVPFNKDIVNLIENQVVFIEELENIVAAKPTATEHKTPTSLKVSIKNDTLYNSDNHMQSDDVIGILVEQILRDENLYNEAMAGVALHEALQDDNFFNFVLEETRRTVSIAESFINLSEAEVDPFLDLLTESGVNELDYILENYQTLQEYRPWNAVKRMAGRAIADPTKKIAAQFAGSNKKVANFLTGIPQTLAARAAQKGQQKEDVKTAKNNLKDRRQHLLSIGDTAGVADLEKQLDAARARRGIPGLRWLTRSKEGKADIKRMGKDQWTKAVTKQNEVIDTNTKNKINTVKDRRKQEEDIYKMRYNNKPVAAPYVKEVDLPADSNLASKPRSRVEELPPLPPTP